MGKIVITRPLEQGRDFAKLCCADGGLGISNFVFEPLLDIKTLNVIIPDINSYDGVILTSIHGAAFLPPDISGASIYCVGEVIGNKFSSNNVIISKSNAADLAHEITAVNANLEQSFLYIRGADIAFDMVSHLTGYGHHIDEIIGYKAVASEEFGVEFVACIKAGDISVITFFSQRTADIFSKLVGEANIIGELKGIKALCISNSMVECLYSNFGENIEVSASPDARSMARSLLSMTNIVRED